MMNGGTYAPLFEENGIKVHCLNMQQGNLSIRGLWTLYKLITANKPDIIQSWMYHADLIGGLVGKLAGVKSIFWNVRHTTLEKGKTKKSTILVAKACAKVSGWVPQKIVYCALRAKIVHEALGYQKDKGVIIGNGFDINMFRADAVDRNAFRELIHIADEEILLGMVGRFDPQKDHWNLITSLGLVKRAGYSFKICLIGKDMNSHNFSLVEYISINNLTDNVLLLGQRTDIVSVMNGLDLHVLSSSFGEAFPNVLAEAMACGTPCATTDVGDSNLIVGDVGWVVPPANPRALAKAIIKSIEEKTSCPMEWARRKQRCRKRIVDNFSMEKMVEGYHRLWSTK